MVSPSLFPEAKSTTFLYFILTFKEYEGTFLDRQYSIILKGFTDRQIVILQFGSFVLCKGFQFYGILLCKIFLLQDLSFQMLLEYGLSSGINVLTCIIVIMVMLEPSMIFNTDLS